MIDSIRREVNSVYAIEGAFELMTFFDQSGKSSLLDLALRSRTSMIAVRNFPSYPLLGGERRILIHQTKNVYLPFFFFFFFFGIHNRARGIW